MAGLTPRPGILEIQPYVGGKTSGTGIVGRRIVKLASNESALGPSPRAVAAYQDAVVRIDRYPDGGAVELRAALAQHHGIDSRQVICGNGSDELLSLVARAYAGPGDDVLISQFGFLMCPIITHSVGARPVVATETDLTADIDALLATLTPRTRVVFLANPNNPTGSYVCETELQRFVAELPANVILVIDAAYAEFVRADDYVSGRTLVESCENVVMTRTFSKAYGLAGLRLGWAYCSLPVADVLNRLRGPFNVSAPALAAGLAALEDVEHTESVVRHNDTFRSWLSDALSNLGLTVYPSAANFVLVEFPSNSGRDAENADRFLAAKGIIPRAMANYGLPDCLRITVGSEADLQVLTAALGEFMA